MCPRSLIAVALLVSVGTGCHGSRWAKRDADYRHKYPRHTDDPLKTVKQAIDARHVRGKKGAYIAGAGRDHPLAAGAELGVFGYAEPWLEVRGGLAGLLHETGDHPISGGAIGSVRLQSPSRLAPFVGTGLYAGWAGLQSASDDGIDNDDNGFVDEMGETDHAFAIAVFPEVGAHLWLTHQTRLTTSVTYYVTNQGRDDDFLFYSVGLSFFGDRYERMRGCPRPGDSSPHEPFVPKSPLPLPSGTNLSPYAELHVKPAPPTVELTQIGRPLATQQAHEPSIFADAPADEESPTPTWIDVDYELNTDMPTLVDDYPSTAGDAVPTTATQ